MKIHGFERALTTPHADVGRWLAALDALEAITREPGFRAIVPGHGPVARDAAPLHMNETMGRDSCRICRATAIRQ